MNKNTIGVIFLIIGILVLLVSVISDFIGLPKLLGLGHDPGFGPYQIIGMVLGIILGGIGWLLKGKN
jgi:hypothetical protein